MDYQVVLSQRFIEELQQVVQYYTEKAGPEIASRFGHQLIDTAEALARHPWAGRPVKRRHGVRRIRFHSYLIFYDVNEDRQRIEVLSLWHGARHPITKPFA